MAEVTTLKTENIAVIVFVVIVAGILGLSFLGYLPSPLFVGLTLLFASGYGVLGMFLVSKKVMPRTMLTAWYIVGLSIAFILIGAIQQGWIPVAAATATTSHAELMIEIVFNATMWTFILGLIFAAAAALIYWFSKSRPAATYAVVRMR